HAVALGQQTTAHGVQPLAERSDDGGKTWQPVPFTAPGPGVSFTALTASGSGFTAAAQFGSSGGTMAAAVWTSASGATWTRTPLRPDDPTRIGHYRLTARLGAGGMGVVYLGISWDGAPVAVKVLRRELAGDEEFRRRFGREVAALVQVKGVCTVRVIEADSQSATPFVVTEYAQGPSLSEYINKHGSVAPDMLFGLATGLAEALTTIHAAGIMHRDLKPSNIILTDAGPKVIDFSIA